MELKLFAKLMYTTPNKYLKTRTKVAQFRLVIKILTCLQCWEMNGYL